ncbi:MAG: glycosyltransferase [Phycisphaeraceae bacterium]|nr:glycosyltransferase [Phycisphaeraceae bacterium]
MSASPHSPFDSTDASSDIREELIEAIRGDGDHADQSPGSIEGSAPPLPALFSGPRVCVALPLYNAGADAVRVLDELIEFAAATPNWEFLFVDDGSTDGTAKLLGKRLAAIDIVEPELAKRFGVLSYAPNAGKGHAVRVAALENDAEYFLFTDGDLAYAPEHLLRLFESLQSADVVIGSRLEHDEGYGARPLRNIMGRVFNYLAGLVLSIRYRDTQAGLKGFRSRAAHDIFSRVRIHDFSFDVEVLYVARKLGYSIAEIPARVDPAHRNDSSTVNLIRDPVRMFWSLCRIRLNKILGLYRLDERDLGEVATRADSSARTTGMPGGLHRRGA